MHVDIRVAATCTAALGHLADGAVDHAMERATLTLHDVRRTCDANEWRAALAAEPVLELRSRLCEDPYTHRGLTKPRGYAGDPVLMDHIYGVAPLPEGTSVLGRAVHAWCHRHSTAFRAVQERRTRLATLVDDEAAIRPVRVLAASSGHLRESQQMESLHSGRVTELVALDSDPESLRVVKACTAGLPVTTVGASVSDLLDSKFDIGTFDVVYSGGLLDALQDRTASKVLVSLAARVRPGGRLVVGNFLPIWEDAYLEAFMEWWLTYRTLEALGQLTVPLQALGWELTLDADPSRSIGYADLRRT